MKRFIVFSLILTIMLLSISSLVSFAVDEPARPLVLTIDVDDMITEGTANRIERGIEEAEARNASALIIVLDTPGGIVDATLNILRYLSASNVPIITFVSPQGSIAASAGAFILLGGHVTAMSEGTTTGAAMPVTISPEDEGTQTADDKTIQFLAGHIRSVAEANGRPGDVAEQFVTENLTLGNQEALELGVVDYIEPDIPSLLISVDGETVELQDRTVTLDTSNATIEPIEPNLTESITHLVSNPQITFILLMLGIYGLIIGFSNPGTFFPEVLGAISLVLALYGLGMFEINLFAVIMMILGIGLLVAEVFTPNYGILGVGGIISLVVGIIYLPVEPLVASRWLLQFRLMAVGVGVVGSVFLIIVLSGIARLRKLPIRLSFTEFTEEPGRATEDLDPEGYIQVRGELWKARSFNDVTIYAETKVRIIEKSENVYLVKPLETE